MARTTRVALRALLLAAALGFAVLAGPVAAASPAPGGGYAGDTRSSGQGAGFAGQPILVAVGVVALGIVTAGATTLYVRLARDR